MRVSLWVALFVRVLFVIQGHFLLAPPRLLLCQVSISPGNNTFAHPSICFCHIPVSDTIRAHFQDYGEILEVVSKQQQQQQQQQRQGC
jgi:hypothetical protein